MISLSEFAGVLSEQKLWRRMQSRLWAAALGRVAGRWRRPLALHVSRCRALSSASQATKLSSKVSDLHRRVMKVPWVDAGETHDVLFEEADAAIAEFRTMYNMSEENRDQLEVCDCKGHDYREVNEHLDISKT